MAARLQSYCHFMVYLSGKAHYQRGLVINTHFSGFKLATSTYSYVLSTLHDHQFV